VSRTIIKFIKKLLQSKQNNKLKQHSDYIIPRNQHHVSKTEISQNALKVLNHLNGAGFEAYLVGGSVRDLLLRKSPKDFDVATDAKPNQIKKLLRNARIIGRRFKLVHVLFHRDIIEVATFRGHEKPLIKKDEHRTNEKGMIVRDNVFGSLKEDAFRRDFTINSLYYDIQNACIIDYTGGFKDIKKRLIRMIGEPTTRFKEDPVRILRAIRFSGKLDFAIEPKTLQALKQSIHLLHDVPPSRLFDEIVKLYQCGQAKAVHTKLVEYGVYQALFPSTSQLFDSKYPVQKLMDVAFESTDARIKVGKPVIPSFILAVMLWFPFLDKKKQIENKKSDTLFSGLTAVEESMAHTLSEQCKLITIPKRHTQVIREIWMFQYRLQKRNHKRAINILQHPRFRAAYDFLGLRALAGDESIELAEWWTIFQDATLKEQNKMIAKQRRKR